MSALFGDELNRRLNTIAVNAVREAQIAIGRGDRPWIDDDWRRANMISQILALVKIEDIDNLREHYPLTSSVQAPKNEKLDSVEKTLADAVNAAFEEIDPDNALTIAAGPGFKIPSKKVA